MGCKKIQRKVTCISDVHCVLKTGDTIEKKRKSGTEGRTRLPAIIKSERTRKFFVRSLPG